jgi:hypothetical protein
MNDVSTDPGPGWKPAAHWSVQLAPLPVSDAGHPMVLLMSGNVQGSVGKGRRLVI